MIDLSLTKQLVIQFEYRGHMADWIMNFRKSLPQQL